MIAKSRYRSSFAGTRKKEVQPPPIRGRRSLLALVRSCGLVAVLSTSWAVAQTEEAAPADQGPPAVVEAEPEAREPELSTSQGAYTHDGFYLRMGLGLGAAVVDLDIDDGGLESSAKGSRVASMSELALGGTLGSGVVLGFGIYAADAGDVPMDIEVHGEDGYAYRADFRTRAIGVVGPFIDYYFAPDRGLHLQAALGLGLAAIRRPGEREDIPLAGLGFMLGLGQEWWLSEQWSMGGLVRVLCTHVSGEHPQSPDQKYSGSVFTPGVLLTATYH